MPIFEYTCSDCETGFEELVRSEKQLIQCPTCGSDKTEKRLSVFAAGSGSSQASESACNRPGRNDSLGCGSGFS